MIAIVADRYEDAADYMQVASAVPGQDTAWIIVLRPEDIRPGLVLTGAVFLADGEAGKTVHRALAAGGLGEPENPQAVEN